MNTYTKKEQSKWISYEPKKEVNRIREVNHKTGTDKGGCFDS